MAQDTLRSNGDATGKGHDQMRDGTIHGAAAKGYGECACDGSSYNKYGSRVDYAKLAATMLK